MSKQTSASRIEWIDVARGITIILMVLGHTSIPAFFSNWIWSFHMPFFFFVAGLTLTTKKYSSFIQYLKHKLQTFLIPFLVFSIINLLLKAWCDSENLLECVLTVAKTGWGGIALWFIPVLFLSELSFFYFEKIRNRCVQITVTILFFVIGWLFCIYGIQFPWSLSTFFVGAAFLFTGNLLNQQYVGRLILYCSKPKTAGFIGLSLLVSGTVISHFWRLDLCSNSVNPIIPLFIGAICGIGFIVIISYHISAIDTISNILKYCGRNSFIILAFSQIFMISIIHLLGHRLFFVRYILMWLLLIVIIEIINRKMPFIMGKK
ncbi:MAG: acyltransferase family protein [Bacteroidales bacterium]|jgi:fucose 4-O-acetylase-like acetyltransferase|nr:acyltransferase family protein [Bacteroidales bacterium]